MSVGSGPNISVESQSVEYDVSGRERVAPEPPPTRAVAFGVAVAGGVARREPSRDLFVEGVSDTRVVVPLEGRALRSGTADSSSESVGEYSPNPAGVRPP